jgi:hypothetical protein
MQINKHGSFYLRNGWPTKIIDVIIQNKYVFSPANEREAVDALGVGRVMVKAMRYWAYATGLTDEDKDQQGVVHSLTELGECVAKYDPFCQDKGTLWLMHRNLASDFENATMWAWAFNLNSQRTFSKDEFVDAFFSFYQTNGGTNKKNAVEKEFDCFKNTYVSDKSFDLSRIIDEDTIPFFAPLGLIKYLGKGRFEMPRIRAKEIPLSIALYCILKDNEEHLRTQHQIDINDLLDGQGQIGRYMSLNYPELLDILQRLENEGALTLVNNFGNRYIEIPVIDSHEVLESYYREELER